jgi:hypothetical protein
MKTPIKPAIASGFLVLLLIVLSACNTNKKDDENPEPAVTLVSEWEGTFKGNVENGNLAFKLYSDNSITLTWETPMACCNTSLGSYDLTGNDFSFTINGSATAGSESSSFSMSSDGTLNATSGSGTYTIVFNSQGWETQAGTWDVDTP